MKKSWTGINGFTLKWIAIITMTIDHVGAVLYPQYTMLRMIGRISFPIFCFLLVEGAMHTGNIRNYEKRLLVFAFISEIPFDLAFYGELTLSHQNVFFTLFLGVCVIEVLRYEKSGIYAVLAVGGAMLLAQELAMDYGMAGIIFILCFYFFYQRKVMKQLAFAGANFWCYQGMEVQYYAALAVIPMLLYNGERGPKMKYFFYLFYPVHLLILYLIIKL